MPASSLDPASGQVYYGGTLLTTVAAMSFVSYCFFRMPGAERYLRDLWNGTLCLVEWLALSFVPWLWGTIPAYLPFYVLATVVLYAAVRGRHRVTVISPFNLPSKSSLPFGEYTVANALGDALADIRNEAAAVQPVPSRKPAGPPREEFAGLTLCELTPFEVSTRFAVEVKGLSHEALLSLARKVWGRERIISGDVVTDEQKFQLIARAGRGGPWKSELKPATPAGLREASRQFAQRVLEDVEPTMLGVWLTRRSEYDEAIRVYRKALAANPRDADALNGLGVALREKGQLGDAIASYEKALRLKPYFPQALYNLGVALSNKGQLNDAIAAYQKALHMKRDFPEALNNLGIALHDKAQPDNAIVAYQKALQLKPEFPEALNNLGIVLHDKAQPDDAIAVYRKALELKPDDPDILNNLACALDDKGDYDAALEAVQKSLKLRPNDPEVLDTLGTVLRHQGDFSGSIGAYQKAISLKPDYALAHHNLGLALSAAGREDEAQQAFADAQRLDPKLTPPE